MTETVEALIARLAQAAERSADASRQFADHMVAMKQEMVTLQDEVTLLKSEAAAMNHEVAVLRIQMAPFLSAFINLVATLETHHGLDRAALAEQTLNVMHTMEGPNLARDEIIRGLFAHADGSKGGQSVM